ncbi:dienelactone hydrolase family protein [Accumulibacter sp.]|jgi:carboxymethylenebutenolidase|uniref:dienelactone hydrolase family protein n=1 Tax=Accumulibacter sp. TaxID=2053492 RepID=UPI001AC7167C|nr:dienelactone hydrolase family protein [Accumulibacter sp.]MBN8455605.1 dienelactone hydrolase family protein [Accumulibacter sp.]
MATVQDSDFDSLVPGLPLSRRTFVGGSLAAGFALAVQPALGQSVVVTPADGLVAGEITVQAPDGVALKAYRAQPAGKGPFPSVLVVQEIFGVHEYIRDVCRRLARQGYQAIAPNLYQRQGDPAGIESVADILAKVVSKVPDAQVLADLDATAAWAAANGGDPARLGITGFCWGGRITWLYAAHNPKLKAGVAWYGRLTGVASAMTPVHPIDVVDKINAPVLGLYGAKDQGIPVSDVEDMKADLAKAGKRAEFVVYPESGHAFHADYRPSYRAEDAADGWRRLLAWFKASGL